VRILLVEDDALLAKATARGLDHANFVVDIATTAEQAYHFLASYDYQFILLDLGLPDRNGLEILKSLRRKKNKVGVIILTAQDQIQERIAGLDAGADDFVVKPYDLYEVIARVQAVLRRISGHVSDLVQIGNIAVNKATKQVLRDQTEVELTQKEFHLLEQIEEDSKIDHNRLDFEALSIPSQQFIQCHVRFHCVTRNPDTGKTTNRPAASNRRR
jgi:two-component system response regulator BasR